LQLSVEADPELRAYASLMRTSSSHSRAQRAAIAGAVVLAVLGVLSLVTEHVDPSAGVTRSADARGVALVLAATMPLAFVFSYPRAAAAVSIAGLLVGISLGYSFGVAVLAPLLVLGAAAYLIDRRSTIVLTLAACVGVAAGLSLGPGHHSPGVLASNVALVIVVALLGTMARVQRQYADALASRTRELEELREVETREAIAQERLRIARDLHDTVGHALAAITLHAQIAQRRVTGNPQRLAEPLHEIVELSSSALAQTRETVGLMRSKDDAIELRALPTLDDLDALITGLRSSDAAIELRREGQPADVPATVQCAAYRIVQESLSNYIKHARPAHAIVTVRHSPQLLAVEIHDDGATPQRRPIHQGSGILGMRERAAALGGTLEAGPAPEGGWTVKSTLPIAQPHT